MRTKKGVRSLYPSMAITSPSSHVVDLESLPSPNGIVLRSSPHIQWIWHIRKVTLLTSLTSLSNVHSAHSLSGGVDKTVGITVDSTEFAKLSAWATAANNIRNDFSRKAELTL